MLDSTPGSHSWREATGRLVVHGTNQLPVAETHDPLAGFLYQLLVSSSVLLLVELEKYIVRDTYKTGQAEFQFNSIQLLALTFPFLLVLHMLDQSISSLF